MARISPLHLIPALIATAAHAAEVTVEPRPFSIEHTFNASVIPTGKLTLLKLNAKAWTSFVVDSVTPHGTKVVKGDTLIRFDSTDIDKKIEDTKRSVESSTLSLAQAEQDAKILEETSKHRLEATRKAAEIAQEENAYFTKTRRKAREETANQALKRSQQILANQEEELRQLTKMYEADDLTEETEEIILIRQRDAVAAAEFALRMENLDHKRTLEVLLPREAITLANNERDTAITLKKVEEEIPRTLKSSKIALQGQRIALTRLTEDLAEMEADRAIFEFKAPSAGWFYHGPIENGRWIPGDFPKALVHRGTVSPARAFATFIPSDSKHTLVSFLDEATARALPSEAAGIAGFPGREDVELPVKLAKLSPTPGPDGTYQADFSITFTNELPAVTGAIAQVRIQSYQQKEAIVVPNKAIRPDSTGWTVEVKLADGKTERRPVQRGRASKEETEILSGLEAGQVVVVPAA